MISVLVLFFTLFTFYTGCQEKSYNKYRDKTEQEETSISYLREICVYPDVIRYFDNVTLYLVVIGVIVIYCNESN